MGGMTRGGWGAATPRAWVARLLGGPGFTATEVRALLRAGGDEARAGAVRRCLARPGDWLTPPPDAFTLPWRYQPLMPRVAFCYARGEEPTAIGAHLGERPSPWAVDRCLAVACERIALCLNRDPAAYGLPC